MSGLSGDQANALSMERAADSRRRSTVASVIALLSVLFLATLLERQTLELGRLVEENREWVIKNCMERRENTLRVNATWEALARIDEQNDSLSPSVRRDRILAYRHAILEVPTCTP